MLAAQSQSHRSASKCFFALPTSQVPSEEGGDSGTRKGTNELNQNAVKCQTSNHSANSHRPHPSFRIFHSALCTPNSALPLALNPHPSTDSILHLNRRLSPVAPSQIQNPQNLGHPVQNVFFVALRYLLLDLLILHSPFRFLPSVLNFWVTSQQLTFPSHELSPRWTFTSPSTPQSPTADTRLRSSPVRPASDSTASGSSLPLRDLSQAAQQSHAV